MRLSFSMNKVVLLFILLVANIHTSYAQKCNYTISGQVGSSDKGSPLSGVYINLNNGQYVAVSDSSGNFKFEKLCKGNYLIKASYMGHEAEPQNISLEASRHIEIFVEENSTMLDPVVITTTVNKAQNTGLLRELRQGELSKSSGLPLADMLGQLPGINVMQTGTTISKPIFHGLHSNRLLTINNGVRQEGQQWGNEHAPEIDPFIADNIAVIKGVDELKYGSDAIGGVVLVNPKPLRYSGFSGELNTGYFTNNNQFVVSAMAEQQLKSIPQLSFRVQGTFKQGGNIQTPDYILNNTSLNEYNFSFTIGYKTDKYSIEAFYSHFQTKVGIFQGSHMGNLADLQTAIDADRPNDIFLGYKGFQIGRPYQRVTHDLLKVKSEIFAGEKAGKLNIQIAAQFNNREEFDIVRNSEITTPQMTLNVSTISEEISWEHPTFKNFNGSIGISAMQQDNTYKGRYLIPAYNSQTYGAYWIEKWKKNKWELQGGIRYDFKQISTVQYPYNNQPVEHDFDFSTIGASFNTIYHLSDHIRINGMVSLANRAPHVNELLIDGIHQGTATYELGDVNLKIEQAVNTVLGLSYSNEEKSVNIDWSVFYNSINNFIYLQPRPGEPVLTIAGAFPKFVYQQADAYLTGTDLLINYKPVQKLDIIGKASLLRAYNKTINDWLISMPSDRFSLGFNYELPDIRSFQKSYIGMEIPLVLKQTRVPDENIHGQQDYKLPPDGYLLTNISAGTVVSVLGRSLNINLAVSNLFNTRYRNYLNSFRYFTDEMGRNISVRLKYVF